MWIVFTERLIRKCIARCRAAKQGADSSVLLRPRATFLALSFGGGGALTEVLHALRCGLVLSSVSMTFIKHPKKKGGKGKKPVML